MLRFSDACIARAQSMGGGSQGSGRWRRRGTIFSVLVPRHSLLSASSALLVRGGGGKRGKLVPASTSAAACLTALHMLSAMLSPASAQINCNAGYFGNNSISVEYNGRVYMTLDGTSPLDTGYKCQNYYLPLPSGWALIDDDDSQYVTRSYPWGTNVMYAGFSRAYYTLNGNGIPGSSYHSPTSVRISGSTYSVGNCDFLILISKTGSDCTACPAGESEIAGRECGTRMCVSVVGGRPCMHTLPERACRMTVRGTRHARFLTNLVSLRIPQEHAAAQVRDMCLSPAPSVRDVHAAGA
jgi:hypothetical protein